MDKLTKVEIETLSYNKCIFKWFIGTSKALSFLNFKWRIYYEIELPKNSSIEIVWLKKKRWQFCIV